MPEHRDDIYWDANVFLSYINGVSERLPVLSGLLGDSRAGSIRIVTSILSIVEVAFAAAEQAAGTLSADAEARIDGLWRDQRAITTVEFHQLIANDARWLIRGAIERGWSLKPADAIHLATAKRLKVAAFHTYDGKLGRFSEIAGCPIIQPALPQGRLL